MEEDADTAVRRAKLKKEKETLKKFTQRLIQLVEDYVRDAALDAPNAQNETV
jgi:hypothetical protein